MVVRYSPQGSQVSKFVRNILTAMMINIVNFSLQRKKMMTIKTTKYIKVGYTVTVIFRFTK